MLRRSFIFVEGITEDMERSLWQRGVLDWDILRKYPGEAADAIGDARSKKLIAAINEADEALQAGQSEYFTRKWPEKELWRLWQGLCPIEKVALLDIETTGRTPGYDQITVIGISNGTDEYAYVAGNPQGDDKPLDDYLEAIKAYDLIVTFNGVSFDIPFIEKYFRSANYHCVQPHIDLIWPARSLGLKGGLKDMEKQVGIARAGDIADMRGNDAIILWGQWQSQGDKAAYDKLVTYCKADCTNLKEFADHIYQQKWDATYTPYANDIDLDASHGEQLSLF